MVYDIPAEEWSQWIGAAKFNDNGHVGVSITTEVILVRDGSPPEDLAEQLAILDSIRIEP